MCNLPGWVPAMFPVTPWSNGTYNDLYQVFVTTIRNAGLRYNGAGVWFFPEQEDGKEVIFWHLTTRSQKSAPVPRRMRHLHGMAVPSSSPQRLPDLRRCERLPWVGPLVGHGSDPDVLAWDYDEDDGCTKTYVWMKDHDFVVIMKKMGNGSRRLITSFYVDNKFTRDDFQRKYAARIQ